MWWPLALLVLVLLLMLRGWNVKYERGGDDSDTHRRPIGRGRDTRRQSDHRRLQPFMKGVEWSGPVHTASDSQLNHLS